MTDIFFRTKLLIGEKALEKLSASHVAVFGVGGVGSFAAEALARAGIGNITLFDSDKVDITNINRQLIADFDTIGQSKVDVMRSRILKINPSANVTANVCFYDKTTVPNYDFSSFDYVIDAIDTISSKLLIISRAYTEKIPIISSMGTGNKLNPLKFEIDDIYNTSVCPFAKVMRRELKKLNIPNLKVIYSKEEPASSTLTENGKRINASISFVPSVAGLILAGEVIKDIIAQ